MKKKIPVGTFGTRFPFPAHPQGSPIGKLVGKMDGEPRSVKARAPHLFAVARQGYRHFDLNPIRTTERPSGDLDIRM